MVKTAKAPATAKAKSGKAQSDRAKSAKAPSGKLPKLPPPAARSTKTAASGKAAVRAKQPAGKGAAKAAAKPAAVKLQAKSESKSKASAKTLAQVVSTPKGKAAAKSAPAKNSAKDIRTVAAPAKKASAKAGQASANIKAPANTKPAAKAPAPAKAGNSKSASKSGVSKAATVAKVKTPPVDKILEPAVIAKVAVAKAAKPVRAVPARVRADASLRKIAESPLPDSAPIRAPQMRSQIVLDPNYRPTDDENFMSEQQREYFRRKLIAWKEDILREAKETLAALQAENENHPDLADRASSETDRAIELRARDRQRKLIAKIDAAIARIEDGSYGYCEETGEPISLRRLEARPIATLSIEAQERHERNEKVHRDD